MILNDALKYELFESTQTLFLKILIIKNMLRRVTVRIYRTYKRICLFDINEHNDSGLHGFEPAV